MLKSLIRFHSAIKLTITTEGGGEGRRKKSRIIYNINKKHDKNNKSIIKHNKNTEGKSTIRDLGMSSLE